VKDVNSKEDDLIIFLFFSLAFGIFNNSFLLSLNNLTRLTRSPWSPRVHYLTRALANWSPDGGIILLFTYLFTHKNLKIMAIKNDNAVVANQAPATEKAQYAVCTLSKVSEEVFTNNSVNQAQYKKVTLTTSTGATARGVMYAKLWDMCLEGMEVNVVLDQVNGDIIPSVVGLPLKKLTLADFGIAPNLEEGI
jgi:hypothetical protein